MATDTQVKPLLVLIHGGASSNRMYKNVIPLLEREGFSVQTPDLPGHGIAADAEFTFEASSQRIGQTITSNIAAPKDGSRQQIVLAGISLGGQAVLSFLQNYPNAGELVDTAIVSGVSIHPPDDKAGWEMPHLPTEQAWMDIIMEDAKIAGAHDLGALQQKSFAFTFNPNESTKLPPILVIVGENDTAMSKRDFSELVKVSQRANAASSGLILKGAWHNHSIDVPEAFAGAVVSWIKHVLQGAT